MDNRNCHSRESRIPTIEMGYTKIQDFSEVEASEKIAKIEGVSAYGEISPSGGNVAAPSPEADLPMA